MQCSCPQCGSRAFKRNGYTRHGKQNHRCLDCGRQFSLDLYLFASETQNAGKGEPNAGNLINESSL